MGQNDLLIVLMVVNNLFISYSPGQTFTFFIVFFKYREFPTQEPLSPLKAQKVFANWSKLNSELFRGGWGGVMIG